MTSGRSHSLTTVDDALAAPPMQHRHGDYNRARAAEDEHLRWQRAQAARTVAREARNAGDCSLLLSILGLDASERAEEGYPSPR